VSIAEKDFMAKYPGKTFNAVQRSLYDCISGSNDEIYKIDFSHSDEANEFN
jgi:hypothetical protein